MMSNPASTHYQTIANLIRYLQQQHTAQPSLAELAERAAMSEYHLQRVFTAWAGVSPKRYLQFLTKQHAKQQLLASADLLSTSIACGLSSPGRLHDLMISCEGVSPGEFKSAGRGVSLGFGSFDSPFGLVFIAWSQRGICHLAFCEHPQQLADEQNQLQRTWYNATLNQDQQHAKALGRTIFSQTPTQGKLHLLLRGTNFQIKVWEALLNTSPGQLVSYGQLARAMGSPNAQRAVGSALASNPIGYLIPCHRVIRESGATGNYRWREERKLAIQGWEAALSQTAETAE